MLFLNTKPKSKEDKELLSEYVSSVENYYHGKFVFGEESDILIKEVRKAIKRHRKDAWKKR
jgi:hypothetical protein